jgi:hypothetical protein
MIHNLEKRLENLPVQRSRLTLTLEPWCIDISVTGRSKLWFPMLRPGGPGGAERLRVLVCEPGRVLASQIEHNNYFTHLTTNYHLPYRSSPLSSDRIAPNPRVRPPVQIERQHPAQVSKCQSKDTVASIEVRTSPVTRGSPLVIFAWSPGVPFVVSECHPDPRSMFCLFVCFFILRTAALRPCSAPVRCFWASPVWLKAE